MRKSYNYSWLEAISTLWVQEGENDKRSGELKQRSELEETELATICIEDQVSRNYIRKELKEST